MDDRFFHQFDHLVQMYGVMEYSMNIWTWWTSFTDTLKNKSHQMMMYPSGPRMEAHPKFSYVELVAMEKRKKIK